MLDSNKINKSLEVFVCTVWTGTGYCPGTVDHQPIFHYGKHFSGHGVCPKHAEHPDVWEIRRDGRIMLVEDAEITAERQQEDLESAGYYDEIDAEDEMIPWHDDPDIARDMREDR